MTILTASASAQISQEQGCTASEAGSQQLAPGADVKHNLRAKETHVFQVMLSPGQYMHVSVNQIGIDVVVKLFDPNQVLLIQRDSPNSKFGPEKVSTVAQLSGNHYLVVCGADNQPDGAYELKLDGPRQPLPADDRRVIAEQVYFQAAKLSAQRNRAALESAIEYYTRSASIWRELGDANEEGYALANLGDLYRDLRQFKESETNLQAALNLLRNAGDISGQAYVLNSWGATYRELGSDLTKGFEKYEEAVVLRRSIGDRWGEAQLRNNLGLLHSRLGQNKEAVEHLKLARALWRELGARDQEMNTLNNIATANLEGGNISEAFNEFIELLNFCAQIAGPCKPEPYVRNSLGMIYDTQAQPKEALEQYNLALALYSQTNGDTRTFQATTLDNLGLLYAGLDDLTAALEKLEEALKLRLELKTPGKEAVTRSNIGYVQILSGRLPEAFRELDQALLLSRATDQRFEGYTLMRLGMAHFKQALATVDVPGSGVELEKAIARYGQALEVQTRIGDIRGQAITLNQIAELYSFIEQAGNARRNYRKAQDRWKEVGDRLGESLSLYGLARLERQQKRFPEARDAIVEAIAKVESVRTSTSNYRLRTRFFEARHDYYELETDVRMQLYYALQAKNAKAAEIELAQALYAAERARSRNLMDLLNESQADIRQGVDPILVEKEQRQRTEIEGKLDLLQTLLTQKGKERQINAVQGELDASNRLLDQTREEIRKRSPRYASLTQPQPLKPAQIQELLDDETCLLQYSIGDERSYLWFVTRQNIRPYTLPPRKKISEAVENLREVIKVHEPPLPSGDIEKHIQKLREALVTYPKRTFDLSSMVLKPVTARMGFERIIIVADGPLQYVPFGALPVPSDANAKALSAGKPLAPLIANHEVVYEPSASVLALLRLDPRRTAPKTVAVIADPVFSKGDERVQAGSKDGNPVDAFSQEDTRYLEGFRDTGDIGSVGGSLRLGRLAYSRKEAEAIVAVAAPGSSLSALDFDASRTKALSEELKQFKIVHLATHGIFDSENPELSGLVFSLVDKDGKPARGFLRLGDIYNLNLPADLVVLSACQTAIGPEAKSEGLTGLTRGFMYAGAARVIASLWKVDDAATAELMKRFYIYMLHKKMPAAEALRRAQLDISTLKEEWRPSFYWAGFILQGEWN
ncbi:MAG TPA: CHAT domain-containing tetratricopeptide repeat protein [Pyrinomonadaceae bacterium]|nr:CHAT domain-containing tetratricopeptide repeat protein [Pyrinomonadaceae bacterium]